MNVMTKASTIAFEISAPPKRRKLRYAFTERLSKRMLHTGAVHAPHFGAAVSLITVPTMNFNWLSGRPHAIIFMTGYLSEVPDRKLFKLEINRLSDFSNTFMGIIHDEVVGYFKSDGVAHALALTLKGC